MPALAAGEPAAGELPRARELAAGEAEIAGFAAEVAEADESPAAAGDPDVAAGGDAVSGEAVGGGCEGSARDAAVAKIEQAVADDRL